MAAWADVKGWEPTDASNGTGLVRQPDLIMTRPRLLDRLRAAIPVRRHSPRTEKAYVRWVVRFVRFHGNRHPADMGEPGIARFLSALAIRGRVSASMQNQALGALLFLYKEVLGRDLSRFDAIVRARRPVRLPVVLSREEVVNVLGRLHGTPWLVASLLYGSGLRLLECCHLRVKDVDLGCRQVTVRDGKGRKDRVTVHLAGVRRQHEEDRRRGLGSVALPDARRRTYPIAAREWPWQWVFPATRFYVDRDTRERRRHHLHESVLQRAVL